MTLKQTNPLQWNVPIVDKSGLPTVEFVRKWAQQQGLNASIPDLSTYQKISKYLDLFSVTQGSILYRDSLYWKALAPGSAGTFLSTNGPNANPAWTPVGAVLLGAGVPSSLQPAGTLYSRTDIAALYSSQPIKLLPSIAQHTSVVSGNTTPGSVTLGAAPTAGNLIIAYISWGDGLGSQPTVTGSWTQFLTILNGGAVVGFALYRYAQPGDTATLPAFCSAGSQYWAAAVYDIGGVTGVFANDVQTQEGMFNLNTTSLTTATQNTATSNALALIFGAKYNGSPNITVSAGWTQDEAQNNAANFGAIFAAHQTVAVSGTGVSGTLTYSAGNHSATAAQVIVASVTVPNWVQMFPPIPDLAAVIDRWPLALGG